MAEGSFAALAADGQLQKLVRSIRARVSPAVADMFCPLQLFMTDPAITASWTTAEITAVATHLAEVVTERNVDVCVGGVYGDGHAMAEVRNAFWDSLFDEGPNMRRLPAATSEPATDALAFVELSHRLPALDYYRRILALATDATITEGSGTTTALHAMAMSELPQKDGLILALLARCPSAAAAPHQDFGCALGAYLASCVTSPATTAALLEATPAHAMGDLFEKVHFMHFSGECLAAILSRHPVLLGGGQTGTLPLLTRLVSRYPDMGDEEAFNVLLRLTPREDIAAEADGWNAVHIIAAERPSLAMRFVHASPEATAALANGCNSTAMFLASSPEITDEDFAEVVAACPASSLAAIGFDGNALHVAAQAGMAERAMELWHALGPELRMLPDRRGRTAQEIAALHGHAQLAAMLQAAPKAATG